MGFSFFLLPAIGGYWFLTHWNRTRYSSLRASGYHIFFKSLWVGVFLFGVSKILLFVFPPALATVIGSDGGGILSFVLGFVLPVFLNRLFWHKEEAELQAARQRGGHMEILFHTSMQQRKYLEISLKSGKSYIGNVVAKKFDSDVEILPFASGYRNRDTHELEITTDYASTIEDKKRRNKDLADLHVVIPVSEIVSARVFDTEIYEKHFKPKDRLVADKPVK